METELPIIRYCKQIQTDILIHSKSFSEDQLRYIRAILLSQEGAGTVPVLQLLSACLKSSRAQSHPERLLGKKRPAAESHNSIGIGSTGTDNNVSNELTIVNEFAGCFDSLWTLYDSISGREGVVSDLFVCPIFVLVELVGILVVPVWCCSGEA
jgi:hypothetical protein